MVLVNTLMLLLMFRVRDLSERLPVRIRHWRITPPTNLNLHLINSIEDPDPIEGKLAAKREFYVLFMFFGSAGTGRKCTWAMTTL